MCLVETGNMIGEKMLNQFRNYNFYVMFILDAVLFVFAHIGAYLFRFEMNLTPLLVSQIIMILPLAVIIKSSLFFFFGLYKGMWRYTGIVDILKLFKASFISSLLLVTIILFVHRFESFSRSVFIIDGILTFLFTGAFRLSIRMAFEQKMRKEFSFFRIKDRDKRKPVLIIGAGSTGEKTLREIMNNPDIPYRVLGFLDDDPKKKGQSIHGISVLGAVDSLPVVARHLEVKQALVATPTATGDQMRRIVRLCNEASLEFKTMPGWAELIEGKVTVNEFREVNYADLLRRPPVQLDMEAIKGYLQDKRILITGAGGSIGSELCRQLLRFKPALMILVDANEGNLYKIQMELKHRANFFNYVTILTGIQNEAVMEKMFTRYAPHAVFHAAAFKHVPMLERNPWQAVLNNIYGTQILIQKSIQHNVERFVFVSTDKAVRPTNIMGASKRVCELLVQAHTSTSHGKTKMVAVRFGNVVGSAGSVIPLFQEQIRNGGPITVTHPEITRFFMTIPEAAQLIIQAGALGTGGEIFILEMGTPIRIVDLAKDLIRLSGKEPERDIAIRFTGLRPGEKLYEELITEGEDVVTTEHKKIMVIKSNGFTGHNGQENYRKWLLGNLNEIHEMARVQDSRSIRESLQKLVPEFNCTSQECVL